MTRPPASSPSLGRTPAFLASSRSSATLFSGAFFLCDQGFPGRHCTKGKKNNKSKLETNSLSWMTNMQITGEGIKNKKRNTSENLIVLPLPHRANSQSMLRLSVKRTLGSLNFTNFSYLSASSTYKVDINSLAGSTSCCWSLLSTNQNAHSDGRSCRSHCSWCSSGSCSGTRRGA